MIKFHRNKFTGHLNLLQKKKKKKKKFDCTESKSSSVVVDLYYRYIRGNKSLQHVAATDHSMCTGRATSYSNKVRGHVATTNRFVCTGEFL